MIWLWKTTPLTDETWTNDRMVRTSEHRATLATRQWSAQAPKSDDGSQPDFDYVERHRTSDGRTHWSHYACRRKPDGLLTYTVKYYRTRKAAFAAWRAAGEQGEEVPA